MAEITQLLPAFPGFAVQYDPSKNPYFRVIMEENLRKLKQVSAGKSLLSSIQAATPAFSWFFSSRCERNVCSDTPSLYPKWLQP